VCRSDEDASQDASRCVVVMMMMRMLVSVS